MNFDDFYKNRYKNQLDWLNDKSAHYKRLYCWGQSIVIVCSASVPFLIKSGWNFSDTIAAIVSLVAAIVGGMLVAFAPFKLWQQYRTTAEALVSEYWMFKCGLDKYGDADNAEKMFAENVQAILKAEHVNWAKLQSSIQKEIDKMKETDK